MAQSSCILSSASIIRLDILVVGGEGPSHFLPGRFLHIAILGVMIVLKHKPQ